MADPVWVASLVDPIAHAQLFDDTAVLPDARALGAAAARTSFRTVPGVVARWRATAADIRADEGDPLQVWASVRLEGDLVPRVEFRPLDRSLVAALTLERPPDAGPGDYLRVMLGTIHSPPRGAAIDLEMSAGAERGDGAVWWDALWLEPDDGTPLGTIAVGVPAEVGRARREKHAEPPLPLPPPPLPAPAKRGRAIPVAAIVVTGIIVIGGATAGVLLTSGTKTEPGGTRTGPPPATGTVSPATRAPMKIAFVAARDGQALGAHCGGARALDVYVLAGAQASRITNILRDQQDADQVCTLGYGEPRWSPDGTKLIARKFFGSSSTLVVMSADGSSIIEISGEEGHVSEGAWSPDGRTIAFISRDRFTRGDTIGLVAPDGSGLRFISGARDASEVVWAPDGATLYTVEGEDLWSIKPDGSNHRRVAAIGPRRGAAVSPLGDRIAVAGADGIFTVPVTGGAPRKIADAPGDESSPSWSTDGSWIVFAVASADGGSASLFMVPSDGGEVRKLTDGSAGGDFGPHAFGTEPPGGTIIGLS